VSVSRQNIPPEYVIFITVGIKHGFKGYKLVFTSFEQRPYKNRQVMFLIFLFHFLGINIILIPRFCQTWILVISLMLLGVQLLLLILKVSLLYFLAGLTGMPPGWTSAQNCR